MKAEQLWASILQEAIQGKLVPQLESEPVVVQIGKAPEDVPFSLPAKWLWMSLNDVLLQISDGSHNPPPNSGVGIPVLSAKNVHDGIIDTQAVTRWTTEEQWVIEDRKVHIESGDVLLTIVGTIGRTAVVPDDALKFMLQRSVCVMKPKNFLRSEFLALMLTSPTLLEWMADRSSGTAQKGIYLKILKTMPIPIPPLGEQQRIIDKLNEIRSVVEVYGKEQQLVELLKGSFANKLKNSILQEAIQGKLVPQLESEPEVTQIGSAPDDVPFDIPKKWKWIQLGNIGRWKAGGTPSRSHAEYYQHGNIPWLKTGDLTDGIVESVEEYITEEAIENSSTHINPIGSVLIAMYGATIGKLGILKFPCATNQACCACDVNVQICDRWYLFYYLLSQRKAFIAKGAGGAQPNISRTKIVNHLIPLPPIEEQRRVVQKIQYLFQILEEYIH